MCKNTPPRRFCSCTLYPQVYFLYSLFLSFFPHFKTPLLSHVLLFCGCSVLYRRFAVNHGGKTISNLPQMTSKYWHFQARPQRSLCLLYSAWFGKENKIRRRPARKLKADPSNTYHHAIPISMICVMLLNFAKLTLSVLVHSIFIYFF